MILYKKDTKGKLRILEILADQGKLIQISGLINGKKVKHSKLCTPKNIGKSNETTIIKQAELERDAIIEKKLQEGYFFTKDEAINVKVILPMLANSYDKHKHKIVFPCYVQPKLDGMRCLKNNIQMISRKNRKIDTLPHIDNIVLPIYDDDIYLDGELYAHGLSFQDNMKLIKKNKPDSIKIEYHVYDLISDKPFIDRYKELSRLIRHINYINLVPTYEINNEEEMKEYHKQFLAKGYEGTIIRHGTKSYEINKRSDSLLKYKDFIDISITITNIKASEKIPNHGVPEFYWKGAKNDTLSAGVKMSHKDREDLLINKNKYIGKTAELRFFEYSDTGVPRFPVMVGIRLDK